MWGGAFPEPLTFSVRALRALRARPGDFDIVHDNQGLGYGMLGLRRLGLPLVTSIHHPITVDRRLDLAGRSWLERLNKRRWYGFVRMQGRVARRAGPLITVSSSSKDDICRDFRVRPGKRAYRPARRGHPAVPPAARAAARPRPDRDRDQRRLAAQGAADAAARGRQAGHRARRAPRRHRHAVRRHQASRCAQLALGDRVTFASGLPDAEYARVLASAEVAVIPSMYEGFSLPAVEHMASGTPLIASRAGALPEVTGDAALLVPPGDPEELSAALRRPARRPSARARSWRERGLARVRERFAWPAVAAATEALYRKVINGEPGC